MKTIAKRITGVVRKVDEQGRIITPNKLIKTMHLGADSFELIDGDTRFNAPNSKMHQTITRTHGADNVEQNQGGADMTTATDGTTNVLATGLVRKVDELGRMVIPSELRKTLRIDNNDSIEIFTAGKQIILKKYTPGCVLTGRMDDLIEYEGVKVSKHAVMKLAQAAGI